MPSSPNILVPSSPDSVADNDGMNELKRKKRQLETQLAEKKKQEQVVKVRFENMLDYGCKRLPRDNDYVC